MDDGRAVKRDPARNPRAVPARCARGLERAAREHAEHLARLRLPDFRRRVKTQRSLPSEDAAVGLLFRLVARGQIKLRRIDGGRKIAAVLSQHTAVAA